MRFVSNLINGSLSNKKTPGLCHSNRAQGDSCRMSFRRGSRKGTSFVLNLNLYILKLSVKIYNTIFTEIFKLVLIIIQKHPSNAENK